MPEQPDATPPQGPGKESRLAIVNAIKSPIAYFTLVLLVTEAIFGYFFTMADTPEEVDTRRFIVAAMLIMLLALTGAMVYLTIRYRDHIGETFAPAPSEEVLEERVKQVEGQIYEDTTTFSPDAWYRKLQPTLYQASYYGAPTYYLDENLNIIDWNIAFALIFSRSLARLRNKPVKYLIAEFTNYEQVVEHGAIFTRKMLEGHVPYADTEPITYNSEKYGPVSFVKVAVQLHNDEGEPQGWAVSLFVKEINWSDFEPQLLEAIDEDKLWSVYSASYDRVLKVYPPYDALLNEVISVVPDAPSNVADIGAGSGNAVAKLLDRGHLVTAVESNLGMLNRMRAKDLDANMLTIIKSSAEDLGGLSDKSFDAVVMINSLYAVTDPLACLLEVRRILKPGGALGISVTHEGTDLTPLLNDMESTLEANGQFPALTADFKAVKKINKQIEIAIARRHRIEDYVDWLGVAGFTVIGEPKSTYKDAVVVIRAQAS